MATHSSILVWKISQTEEAGGLQSRGFKELDMTDTLDTRVHTYIHTHTHTHKIIQYMVWSEV